MEPKQAAPCVFCGKETEERHQTSIGVLHIHPDCVIDLEDVLSVEEREETCSPIQGHWTTSPGKH